MLRVQAIIYCDCPCEKNLGRVPFRPTDCQVQTWASIPISPDGKLDLKDVFVPGDDWTSAGSKTYCPKCHRRPDEGGLHVP